MRRKMLIGNWKLNHTQSSARAFFAALCGSLDDYSFDLAIAPVAPMLQFVGELVDKTVFALAAQNVFYEAKGAFTGEWSVAHLRELGVRYCIVGHSERRMLFGERDDAVAKKVNACLAADIMPVICVGESLSEREALQTRTVITRQVTAVLDNLDVRQNQPLIFAYEPIWAIGTGTNATPAQAEEVHQLIRQLLAKSLGQGLAEQSRILYGGSVNAQNISALAANPNVDGALVGGASLQADSFLSMVKALHVGE